MKACPQFAVAPMFTVITAAYNCSATIAETIRSVLFQDRDDWEHIIVDDGSTDGTAEVARRAAAGDPRVQILTQANAGRGAARNAAIRQARGEYFCILDADDLYVSGYLSSQAGMIARYPDRSIYSCNGMYLYPSGLRVPIWRGSKYSLEREYTVPEMLRRNLIFTMAVVRRSAVESVGGYSSSFVEDYDLWMRILLSGGRHIYNPERIGLYRITPGSAASNRDTIESARLQVLESLARTFSDVDAALMDREIEIQRARVEIAVMERDLVRGDAHNARRTFWRNVHAVPTLGHRVLGGATMLVHPALYRRVFLERLAHTDRISRPSPQG